VPLEALTYKNSKSFIRETDSQADRVHFPERWDRPASL
jgi:hypothetical protein